MLNLKNSMQVSSALSHLVRNRYIERYDVPGERARGTRSASIPSLTDGPIWSSIRRLSMRRIGATAPSSMRWSSSATISDTCRQQWILEYFGESRVHALRHLRHLCRGSPPRSPRSRRARSFSSCKRRSAASPHLCPHSRRRMGGQRFGKGKIVQMLTGSKVAEISASRLDTAEHLRHSEGSEGSAYVFALTVGNGKGRARCHAQDPLPAHGPDPARHRCDERRQPFPHGLAGSHPDAQIGQGGKETSTGFDELAFDEALFEKLKEVRRKPRRRGRQRASLRDLREHQVLEFFTRLRPTS
jgi:ATP-dependent DNA helicase RecQ